MERSSNIMANKSNLTLRMEPELKAQAAALFKALGMDLSTARRFAATVFLLRSSSTSRTKRPTPPSQTQKKTTRYTVLLTVWPN